MLLFFLFKAGPILFSHNQLWFFLRHLRNLFLQHNAFLFWWRWWLLHCINLQYLLHWIQGWVMLIFWQLKTMVCWDLLWEDGDELWIFIIWLGFQGVSPPPFCRIFLVESVHCPRYLYDLLLLGLSLFRCYQNHPSRPVADLELSLSLSSLMTISFFLLHLSRRWI